MYYRLITINKKKVYVLESHHHALQVWAEFRRNKNNPPTLVSLDHHTDTHTAFLNYFSEQNEEVSLKDKSLQLISTFDFNDDNSITNTIEKLKNDEHIDAAIKANIIKNAFLLTYMSSFDDPLSNEEAKHNVEITKALFSRQNIPIGPLRPYTYPKSKIYIIGNQCSVGCSKEPHDEECRIPHYNQAIETIFLRNKLSIMNEMLPGIIENDEIKEDYILDIDLDYFHTMTSIQPQEPHLFYELIRKSSIITIATEPWYVSQWKYFDNEISSDFLLEKMLQHIEIATS